jgi:hypothetical protein
MYMNDQSHHLSSITPLKKNFATIKFNSWIDMIPMYSKELKLDNATSTLAAISALLLSPDDGLSDDWCLSSL